MTVQELIEELQKYPNHMIVVTTKNIYRSNDRIADGVHPIGDSKVYITSHVPDEGY